MAKVFLVSRSSHLLAQWQTACAGREASAADNMVWLQAEITPADLLLLDLAGWPGGLSQEDGERLCRQARVIALASLPDNEEGLRWLQAGAVGYAHAYLDAASLGQILATVEAGGSWIGQSLMQYFCSRFGSLVPVAEVAPWRDQVSGREAEVIEALCRGLSNKEIARELNITERTVKAHLASLFNKFSVHDRLQLIIRLTRAPHLKTLSV